MRIFTIGFTKKSAKHFFVARLLRELTQLEQVIGARIQALPRVDFLAQALGRAQNLLSGALVVPEVGCAGLLIELGQALRLCG